MVDQPVCACDLMLFGASGDLAQRKLFPALYQLDRAGLLASDSRVLAIARRDTDTAALRKALLARLEELVPASQFDATVAQAFEVGVKNHAVSVDSIPADSMILDVGPASINDLVQRLGRCRTVVWNGPLGAFEISPFDAGTNAVARETARLTQDGFLLSVAGGGDTVAALRPPLRVLPRPTTHGSRPAQPEGG